MSDRFHAVFWGFDLEEPSFRHRMQPLVATLERRGWRCTVQKVPNRRGYVRRILERRSVLQSADVLIMHRIKLSPFESAVLRKLARRVIYDIDDAIFLRRPRRLGQPPGRSWFRLHKFFNSCRVADVVTAGNSWLADVAGRVARRVEVAPTSVEVASDPGPQDDQNPAAVVWIGLPENLVYLNHVRQAFERLAMDGYSATLRVVSSGFPEWAGVPVERVSWSPEIEKQAIRSAGIGIMPLTDDDWAKGKCAFKLLQYMAEGLPCIASPVGANCDVVVDGETGLFASSPDQWFNALRELLTNHEKARAFGAAGLDRVRSGYERSLVMGRMADLVEEVVLEI